MLDKRIIYFITVAEEGSFSAAARKLILSQAALSQQVSLLEEEIGVMLFDRGGYRPVLTEAGRVFYQGCVDIKGQYDNLKKNVQYLSFSDIRIGFTGSFENKELLDLVNKFKKDNPYISISFIKNTFDGCVRDLINGVTDVCYGVNSTFRGINDIIYEELFQYNICVICSYDHLLAEKDEVDIAELKDENYFVLSKKFGYQCYKDFLLAFRSDGFKPRIKKEFDSLDEIIFHVSTGKGIAIVSENVVRKDEVKRIKLVNSHHQSKYAIAYLKGQNNIDLKKLINFSRQYFRTL